ncbi:hypothetical protein ACFY36_01220 [Actinoplanes sp. NPDC000266]
MSPARIAADTEKLNSRALQHAALEIRRTIGTYESGVAGVGPVVLHQRDSELDKYVTRLITEVPTTTRMLLSLIDRACVGDAGATGDMAAFFERGEELNVVEARGGDFGTHH